MGIDRQVLNLSYLKGGGLRGVGGTRWYKTRLGAGFTLAGGEGGGRRQGERKLELLNTCACPALGPAGEG